MTKIIEIGYMPSNKETTFSPSIAFYIGYAKLSVVLEKHNDN